MGLLSKKNLPFYAAAFALCTFSIPASSESFFIHSEPAPKPKAEQPIPWLTGPLLTPSGHVVPPGHWNFEPYLFVTTNYGVYNNHWKTVSTPKFYSVQSQNPIQYGIGPRMDVQIVPQFAWNHTDGASEWLINDLPLLVDVQILYDQPGKWWPAIKFTLNAEAPIGKYQKLDPKKLGTDAGGRGTWDGTVALVFSRLFHFHGVHFLAPRWYFGYSIPNPVHVKGLNAYGGGKGTHGKAYPGNEFTTTLGLEYTLAQRWALACDFQYVHSNKNRFSGKTIVPVGAPSSEQFSIAPAFEYNWSANVGLIAGAWFSLGGRNTTEFASGVIAVNIYK